MTDSEKIILLYRNAHREKNLAQAGRAETERGSRAYTRRYLRYALRTSRPTMATGSCGAPPPAPAPALPAPAPAAPRGGCSGDSDTVRVADAPSRCQSPSDADAPLSNRNDVLHEHAPRRVKSRRIAPHHTTPHHTTPHHTTPHHTTPHHTTPHHTTRATATATPTARATATEYHGAHDRHNRGSHCKRTLGGWGSCSLRHPAVAAKT